MKRKVLSALACIALSVTSLTAQETGFGAKLGANIASMSGDVEDGATSRTSMHIGGFYNMMLSETFGLQFELVYSGQGYTVPEETVTDQTGTYTLAEVKYKLDYINIPILAKYYITSGLNVLAGPQIGINIGAKALVDGETFDLEEINTIDFAFGLGLQYELEMGVGFGARYNIGLTDVDSQEDFTFKNNVIQISAQYQF